MSNDEIEIALDEGFPVESKGVVYKCISAIITRKKDGKRYTQVELLDRGGNSVTIENPSFVKKAVPDPEAVECPF